MTGLLREVQGILNRLMLLSPLRLPTTLCWAFEREKEPEAKCVVPPDLGEMELLRPSRDGSGENLVFA